MALPAFADGVDLPVGVHPATLGECLERFGTAPARRRALAGRLERIYHLALATGGLARFVVFGSFITAKPEPNDVDVFMLMIDAFDADALTGDARLLFDHAGAQTRFGASVFWLRRLAALGGEEQAIADWQVKRDGNRRGIVEIVSESP
jgi:hypothetical protein